MPPGIAPNLVEQSGSPYATAVGYQALNVNTGLDNTAAGYVALFFNTTGSFNTAAGTNALVSNTTGFYNTATGVQALNANTTGDNNTAAGNQALNVNTTGSRNVGLGYQAGSAQTTGSDNVYVANAGVAAESGKIRIGTSGTHTDTYLAGTVRATAFVGSGAGLTGIVATTTLADDLACTGCVSASEVSFNYAGSASAGGPATSAITSTTATTALTSADASALGGQPPSAYATAGHTHAQFGSMLLQGSTGQNTALGTGALGSISSGTANLALGYQAGNAQTTGSNNVYLANAGVARESGKIRIGAAGTHTDTYLTGTVHVTALVYDGAGGDPGGRLGAPLPPSPLGYQELVNEVQTQRRIIAEQEKRFGAARGATDRCAAGRRSVAFAQHDRAALEGAPLRRDVRPARGPRVPVCARVSVDIAATAAYASAVPSQSPRALRVVARATARAAPVRHPALDGRLRILNLGNSSRALVGYRSPAASSRPRFQKQEPLSCGERTSSCRSSASA
jgi:hypothetical protein